MDLIKDVYLSLFMIIKRRGYHWFERVYEIVNRKVVAILQFFLSICPFCNYYVIPTFKFKEYKLVLFVIYNK